MVIGPSLRDGDSITKSVGEQRVSINSLIFLSRTKKGLNFYFSIAMSADFLEGLRIFLSKKNLSSTSRKSMEEKEERK